MRTIYNCDENVFTGIIKSIDKVSRQRLKRSAATKSDKLRIVTTSAYA